MNRTKGILVGAAVVVCAAFMLALGGTSSPGLTAVEPPPPPKQNGLISLTSKLSHSHLLRGSVSEAYLDVAIHAADAPDRRRLPVNLALVVDRSGSMAGQKLANARQAARNLVLRLRDGDRLALVTYGSDVSVLVPSTRIDSASRAQLLSAIAGIHDRGGTFLSGGLETGQAQVQAHLEQEQISRVILISDGQANEGVTTGHGLAELARRAAGRGVSVTTMGVGLDFNEDVMTAMADAGAGHYYFIRDSETMAGIFSKELEFITATVARTPELQIELAPGVEMLEVYGYDHTQNGRTVSIRLPAIYGKQQRKVICRLRVPAHGAGTAPVADVRLAFREIDSGDTVTIDSAVAVAVTADPRQVARGENLSVAARVAEVEAAKTLDGAMRSYAGGNQHQAGAMLQRQIVRARRLANRAPSPTLDRMVRDLKSRLEATSQAAPSSPRGRALIKGGKAQAYELAH